MLLPVEKHEVSLPIKKEKTSSSVNKYMLAECPVLCTLTKTCAEHAPPHASSDMHAEGAPRHSSSSIYSERTFSRFSSDDECTQHALPLHLPYTDHEMHHLLNANFKPRPLHTRSNVAVEARAQCAPQQHLPKCTSEANREYALACVVERGPRN